MTPPVYTSAVAVTPSDSGHIPATAAIYVGGAGNVTVVLAGAGRTTATFTNVAAGTTLPVAAVQVKATGTSATYLLALR